MEKKDHKNLRSFERFSSSHFFRVIFTFLCAIKSRITKIVHKVLTKKIQILTSQTIFDNQLRCNKPRTKRCKIKKIIKKWIQSSVTFKWEQDFFSKKTANQSTKRWWTNKKIQEAKKTARSKSKKRSKLHIEKLTSSVLTAECWRYTRHKRYTHMQTICKKMKWFLIVSTWILWLAGPNR